MTRNTPDHAGIELDLFDFSKMDRISSSKQSPESFTGKIDFQLFVKSLYKKILDNDSFLSFSGQINDVNAILQTKYSSAGDIADVILKDMALTTKLLKLVNSSFYGNFSHKGISTVSEAMIILGTEEIKLAAASLKLYEFMKDIATVKVLKDKALKALQRSLLALKIAKDEGTKHAEGIQISAMLYDFGEYLVALFYPQVYIRIEILSDEKKLTKEQASKSVIGISYGALGRFLASKWQLPDGVIKVMTPVADFDKPKNSLGPDGIQQYICSFSNDLCNLDASLQSRVLGQKITSLCQRYDKSLQIPPQKAAKLLTRSWHNINKHAEILGI